MILASIKIFEDDKIILSWTSADREHHAVEYEEHVQEIIPLHPVTFLNHMSWPNVKSQLRMQMAKIQYAKWTRDVVSEY